VRGERDYCLLSRLASVASASISTETVLLLLRVSPRALVRWIMLDLERESSRASRVQLLASSSSNPSHFLKVVALSRYAVILPLIRHRIGAAARISGYSRDKILAPIVPELKCRVLSLCDARRDYSPQRKTRCGNPPINPRKGAPGGGGLLLKRRLPGEEGRRRRMKKVGLLRDTRPGVRS